MRGHANPILLVKYADKEILKDLKNEYHHYRRHHYLNFCFICNFMLRVSTWSFQPVMYYYYYYYYWLNHTFEASVCPSVCWETFTRPKDCRWHQGQSEEGNSSYQ